MPSSHQHSPKDKDRQNPQPDFGDGTQSVSAQIAIGANLSNERKISRRPGTRRPGTRRPGMPKAKTGCKTCRIRRVKCDETRPSCQRCIKFGISCDGYPAGTLTVLPGQRKIIPKVPEPYVPPTRYIQPALSFISDNDSRFYTLYTQETALQISGPFQTSLWSRLIPQACETEPFMRQLAIAIAALSQACTSEFSSHGHLWAADKRSTYSYALKKYDKALQGMRDAILKGRFDFRNALLACLLVFCFESLQGDANSATNHAMSGLALLQEWLARRTVTKAVAVPRTGRFEGLDVEILHAFAQPDIQMQFWDRRSATQHLKFLEQFSDTVKTMPRELETLEDVRAYWLLIQRRNYHFSIAAIDGLANPKADANSEAQDKNQDHRKTARWGWDSLHNFSNLHANKKASLALRAQMESHREDIRRWFRASATVFALVESEGAQKDRVIMQLLSIHAYLNHVELAVLFMTSEVEYDAFLPEYTAIVELSEAAHPYLASVFNEGSGVEKTAGGLFRFERGIVYPLSRVGFHCRNSRVRNRAIAILNKSFIREGIWDSLTVGRLTSWIRNVEEDGMDPSGFIPEDRRAVLTLCDIDLKTQSARLECISRGPNGETKCKTETVEWNFSIKTR